MKIKHFVAVINGNIKFADPVKWSKQLSQLNGAECFIAIEKKTKQRSLNENNYYWGVIVPIISEHLGYTNEEAHEALKWQFLRKESGKIATVRSTADLTTVEFEKYCEDVRIWASSFLGVFIPLPNEILV